MGQGFLNAVPGAYYAGQSQIAWGEGRYFLSAGLYAAALGDAAMGVLTLGESTAAVGAARGAAVAGRELVNVTHFTSAEGVAAIEEAGALRAGSFVALPGEVSGLNALQVESALEIQAGRGAFSVTFQTPASNLLTPFNGPLTSGFRTQFQLLDPAPIGHGSFIPTP